MITSNVAGLRLLRTSGNTSITEVRVIYLLVARALRNVRFLSFDLLLNAIAVTSDCIRAVLRDAAICAACDSAANMETVVGEYGRRLEDALRLLEDESGLRGLIRRVIGIIY